nr:proteasome inhibitor PI31 subunit [Danaus plexippus plexippus]
MATEALFGWDLTFKTVEKDIKQKSDVIIAFIHWNLTKRGFRSIGIGDERTLSGDEERSELLPTGWNDKENYTLRYVYEDKLYILHGLNSDGNLIVNLMRSEDLAVSNIALKVEESVKDMSGPIDKVIPGYKDLMFNVRRDLIDTITARSTSSAQTQTIGNNTNNPRPPIEDPLRIPPRPAPGIVPENPNLWLANNNCSTGHTSDWPVLAKTGLTPSEKGGDPGRRRAFTEAGLPARPQPGVQGRYWRRGKYRHRRTPVRRLRREDALAASSLCRSDASFVDMTVSQKEDTASQDLLLSSMFSAILESDNCRRGSVPPGARFDPFGPPGVGPLPGRRPPPPDADHLPPPGFNDNMFM